MIELSKFGLVGTLNSQISEIGDELKFLLIGMWVKRMEHGLVDKILFYFFLRIQICIGN